MKNLTQTADRDDMQLALDITTSLYNIIMAASGVGVALQGERWDTNFK